MSKSAIARLTVQLDDARAKAAQAQLERDMAEAEHRRREAVLNEQLADMQAKLTVARGVLLACDCAPQLDPSGGHVPCAHVKAGGKSRGDALADLRGVLDER